MPKRLTPWPQPPHFFTSLIQHSTFVCQLDKNDKTNPAAKLFKLAADGSQQLVLPKNLTNWGKYLRYDYRQFDYVYS